MMGHTALTSEPVMCVDIFSGTNLNPLCKNGLALSNEIFGSTDNDKYLKKNYGPGKRFPGVPT